MRTYATILCLMLTTGSSSWAVEPTLARLSFWVPPERQAIPADQAQVHRQTAPGILRTSLCIHSRQESNYSGPRMLIDEGCNRLG